MRITATIPDELAAQAQARGFALETYVEGLIEHAAGRAGSSLQGQARDMGAFFKDMAASSEKIPQLPNEACSRESFYRDRD